QNPLGSASRILLAGTSSGGACHSFMRMVSHRFPRAILASGRSSTMDIIVPIGWCGYCGRVVNAATVVNDNIRRQRRGHNT
ncbi:MAG: hypothetical protein L0J71_05685, partial [Bifidobacterium crudilactis]|nr:hypothetical protein [Bifidobacterium crudilactis]